jgi:signal peptidase I
MKVVTQSVPVIKIGPRLYPNTGDTLVLELETLQIIDIDWVRNGNLLEITLNDLTQFEQRGNYSFTVTNNDVVIYKGKIIFLKNDTDVQNYSNQTQDNKRWQ